MGSSTYLKEAPPPYSPRGQMQPTSINQSQTPTLGMQYPDGGFQLKHGLISRLGICSLFCGAVILLFGIYATVDMERSNQASCGFWGGTIIMISGIVAILSSASPKNKSLNSANLGLHIIVLPICVAVLVVASFAVDYFKSCVRSFVSPYWGTPSPINRRCPEDKGSVLSAYSFIVAFTCLQMWISVAMVVICSRAYQSCRTYCGSKTYELSAATTCMQYQAPQGMIYPNTQQRMVCPNAQMLPQSNYQHFNSKPMLSYVQSNMHAIQTGQSMYMLTPVSVTSEKPTLE